MGGRVKRKVIIIAKRRKSPGWYGGAKTWLKAETKDRNPKGEMTARAKERE
jgi:hypothetical protein